MSELSPLEYKAMPGTTLQADLWINEYMTPWDIYAHGITSVIEHKKTAFQDMYIVESGIHGRALVLDGKWQSAEDDEFLYHEPLCHPLLVHQALTHAPPKRVLVLGGGEGATAREVLRWRSVERVLMIDIDAEVVDACKKHLKAIHQGVFDDPRLEVHIGDALEFLNESAERWDAVISDLSDPIEEGPSFRLFTKEYFQRVERVLAPAGSFVLQAGPVSPAEMTLHVRTVNTVKAVFPHVQPYSSYVPSYGAPWGFALASRQPVDSRPSPEEIDALLTEHLRSELRMLDGSTLLGLLQVPAHVRRRIAAETQVYTLDAPPKFFGKSGGGTALSRSGGTAAREV